MATGILANYPWRLYGLSNADRLYRRLNIFPLTAVLVALAALFSWLAILVLRPWLATIASARMEARSSHRLPTPQGAGIGMVAAIVIVAGCVLIASGVWEASFLVLAGSLMGLALLGFVDDVRPLPWGPKLAAQSLAALAVVATLPSTGVLPAGLLWLERLVLVIALLAIINIVNFIDGIDEITVAHATPAMALMTLAAALLPLSHGVAIIAAASLGALIGFWLWNRHPARIFLGDAGSLPLGLLLGWLALQLLTAGHWAAAMLMLAYPLADGGLTLLRRLLAGRRLTEPHRDHAYQRAVDSGMAAPRVALTVFLVSLVCAGLALLSVMSGNVWISIGALAVAGVWVLVPIIGWLRRRASP